MITRWRTLRVDASVAFLLLLSGLTGCVFGQQSDPPILTVDLYWAYDPRTGHDWTCETVPVASTQWRLRNSQGDVVAQLDPKKEKACDDRINFYNLDMGKYELEVTGFNQAGDKAWESTCQLELDRFDRLSDCTVNQIGS